MNRLPFCFLAVLLSACSAQSRLSKAEQSQGWKLLFDGRTSQGWRGAYSTAFPQHGWVIRKGELRGQLNSGGEAGDAGDIVTLDKYKNFELVFEWKLGAGGNSGVKYFVEEKLPRPAGSQPGYEYQLIDDVEYIYNGKKLPPNLKTAALYDLVAADKADLKVGDWHKSKIIVLNDHIEHWLDGNRVLVVDRQTQSFQQSVTDSKFKNYIGFDQVKEGYILLQDHGHNVSFKNIKLREL
jgi:Domain of Unknown Function (DUF1080)